MALNLFTIKTVGKLNFSAFSSENNSSQNVYELWGVFWKDYLNGNVAYFSQNEEKNTLPKTLIDGLSCVIWNLFTPQANALDIFFIYNVLQEIAQIYKKILPWWDFHYANGITSKWNDFSPEKIDYSLLQSPDHFLQNLISRLLEGVKREDNQPIVIEIFWPTEFTQAVYVAAYFKKNYQGCKVFLSLEKLNEQFSPSSLLDSITTNSPKSLEIFDFISVQKWDIENFSWELPSLEEKASLSPQEFVRKQAKYGNFFWKNVLYTRMYPFRCFWNACFFCTINDGNDNAFPNSDVESVFPFVDAHIQYLVSAKVDYVSFLDEAIHPRVLQYFVEQILKKWIKISYLFRMRYEQVLLDEEFVSKLALSGAKFCWIWLEAASHRMAKMYNKWEIFSLWEKFKVAELFDTYNIHLHNYSIYGFPWETKEEMLLTFKFLCSCIEKFKYYTCTPNIYGLMRGSYIYKNQEKFELTLVWTSPDDVVILDFAYRWIVRDNTFIRKLISQTHRKQFTSFLDIPNPTDFWLFIDRTGIFYWFKALFEENPYLFRFKKLQAWKNLWFDFLTSKCYKKTSYFVLDSWFFLKSYITNRYRVLWKEISSFLSWYDEKISLKENLYGYHFTQEEILFLIENVILSCHEEEFRSIYNQGL